MAKLTGPQQELLRDVYEGNGHVPRNYKPAQRLVELGLCVWNRGKYSDYLDLTARGRAALEKEASDG